MEQLGLPFQVCVADVDERSRPGEQPIDLVARLAYAKAQHVAAQYPRATVIGADTIVTLEGALLGKPADPREAVEMLQRLRDRAQQVYSGVSVFSPACASGRTEVVESTVWMRRYSEAEIEHYVAGGSPLDKAGAYGIQDAGMRPVARLEGCYASVMGLPLCALAELLQDCVPATTRSPRETQPSLTTRVPAVCSTVTGLPCCAGARKAWMF